MPRLRLAFAVSVLLLVPITAPAGEKKPLAVEDLYLFDAPRTPALFPDGQKAVYVRTWIDGKTKQERHSLWLADGSRDKVRPLEPGEPDARSPVVSPDGRWIAFLSTRPRPHGWKPTPPAPPPSDPAVDLWLIPTAGGPAIPLGGPDRPWGRVLHDGFYGRVTFSPDGTKIAFVADDGADPRTPAEIANDVLIVRPDQGEGYTGYGAAQVWVAHLDAEPKQAGATKVERLTRDDVWYGDPQWSPDGKTLVVHANKTPDRESVRYSINKDFDLWAIDVATAKQSRLTSGPGPDVSPRFSPDGKRIAFLTIPRKGSHRDVFSLAVVTLGDGGPATRVVFDQFGPGADKPPHLPPLFPLPDDCWLGNQRIGMNCEAGVGNRFSVVDINTGKAETNDESGGRKSTAFKDSAWRQKLIPPGNAFLRDRLVAPSKTVTWKNEGYTLDGVLTTPPPGVAKAPYKLVVHPHGGPHGRAAVGFDFTVQLLAAHGYAVFQPNFRGSSGHGQKFIDADRGDFGGGDMRDILTGIDMLVRDGVADRDRQFVYGVSYGGFMTSWLVGQTNQFKAAVAQNAVTDLAMMWGLSDLQSWTEWEFSGRPWETPAGYRAHSPLTHAANVRTPTLILHAAGDRRCPLPMGKAFHQALLARGVPTEMVIYPGEGHGIRQPPHREDVYRRVLAWFAKHGG
jgi:dipeptidyl aminopeptidase/acylaminoacyl peptidase